LERIAPTGRLLEVGCALGFLLHGLQRFSAWQVVGIDVSSFAVYFARRRFDLDVRCGTLAELAFDDDAFDFIVQKDLLEHVPDPRAHLDETVRILKPGGHVWIVTPNGDADIGTMRQIAGQIQDESTLPCLDQGHVSFFRMEHLLRLFDEAGLDCVRARNVDFQRGVRALGILPLKKKSYVTAPRGNPREERCAARDDSAGNDTLDYETVYNRIRTATGRSHQPFRASPAYFYIRQLSKTLNSLPARFRYGCDFDFLLRKR
ncbi:MAG: class I SAM-dependent methyltransferase, partial [Candidatus Latescibacterota bacterium]